MKFKIVLSLTVLAGCGAQAFEFDSWAPRWSLAKAIHYKKVDTATYVQAVHLAGDMNPRRACEKIASLYEEKKKFWNSELRNANDFAAIGVLENYIYLLNIATKYYSEYRALVPEKSQAPCQI